LRGSLQAQRCGLAGVRWAGIGAWMMDLFLQAAIAEAEQGLREGGIPIGAVLVHGGRVIGRGHNRRVQRASAILHGEMDALENAGRLAAGVYRESTMYTTLSPCAMCTGAILLYGLPLHPAHEGIHSSKAGVVERRHRRLVHEKWPHSGPGDLRAADAG
jgi:hypothetical protein